MKNYIVEHGCDSEFSDGEYEYYGVYNKDGDICAIFYVDAIPNAQEAACKLCNDLNS